MSPAEKPPHALELRRIGIDTHRHAEICMRSDCHGCRSEGLEAETHGLVRNGNREAPHVVLREVRRGDRDVEVSPPDVERWRDRTPVLVDDVVPTARTMVAVARQLTRQGELPPVCIAVHALFAGAAFDELRAAGVARIASCNTVHHASNEIDVAPDVAAAVERWCRGGDIVDDVKLEG